jgi:hypothetical protein
MVECRRVNGRPRQKFVAHLGTIQVWENGMGEVPIGTGGRAYPAVIIAFWDRLSRKLNALQAPHDRDAIEARVSAKVPRPDAAMREGVAALRTAMHRRESTILWETGLAGRP